LKETEKQRIEEGSASETKNDTPIQLVADFKQKAFSFSIFWLFFNIGIEL
jgi:hypothetical protein